MKWSSTWKRLGAVLLSSLALVFVLRRLQPGTLLAVLRMVDLTWLVAAVAACGLASLFCTVRWHLILRLTGSCVSWGVSAKSFLVGYALNLVLFGPAGGDVVKGAFYSRWYRTPLPELLAAMPLDRLLGLGGVILAGICGVGLAAAGGGLPTSDALGFRVPGTYVGLLVVVAAIGGVGLIVWGNRLKVGRGPARRFVKTLSGGLIGMLAKPGIGLGGLALSGMTQLSLCVSLAFCLQAVHVQRFDWMEMFWTLPVISMMSAMPSVAGLGFREGAALALLGLYGITGENSVAASLCFLAANGFWGVVGGLVMWREEASFRRRRVAECTNRALPFVGNAAEPDV